MDIVTFLLLREPIVPRPKLVDIVFPLSLNPIVSILYEELERDPEILRMKSEFREEFERRGFPRKAIDMALRGAQGHCVRYILGTRAPEELRLMEADPEFRRTVMRYVFKNLSLKWAREWIEAMFEAILR